MSGRTSKEVAAERNDDEEIGTVTLVVKLCKGFGRRRPAGRNLHVSLLLMEEMISLLYCIGWLEYVGLSAGSLEHIPPRSNGQPTVQLRYRT
jgi:hypothetical protein